MSEYGLKVVNRDGYVNLNTATMQGGRVFAKYIEHSNYSSIGAVTYYDIEYAPLDITKVKLYIVQAGPYSVDRVLRLDNTGKQQVSVKLTSLVVAKDSDKSVVAKILVFLTEVQDTGIYGISTKNTTQESLISAEYPIPEYLGRIEFIDAPATPNQLMSFTSESKYTNVSYKSQDIVDPDGRLKIAFFHIPSNSNNCYYNTSSFIGTSSAYNIWLNVIHIKGTAYNLPVAYIFALDKIKPSSNETHGLRVYKDVNTLVFDSGLMHLNIVGHHTLKYSSTVSTNVNPPPFGNEPAILIPGASYYTKFAIDGSNSKVQNYIGVVRRVGSNIESKLIQVFDAIENNTTNLGHSQFGMEENSTFTIDTADLQGFNNTYPLRSGIQEIDEVTSCEINGSISPNCTTEQEFSVNTVGGNGGTLEYRWLIDDNLGGFVQISANNTSSTFKIRKIGPFGTYTCLLKCEVKQTNGTNVQIYTAEYAVSHTRTYKELTADISSNKNTAQSCSIDTVLAYPTGGGIPYIKCNTTETITISNVDGGGVGNVSYSWRYKDGSSSVYLDKNPINNNSSTLVVSIDENSGTYIGTVECTITKGTKSIIKTITLQQRNHSYVPLTVTVQDPQNNDRCLIDGSLNQTECATPISQTVTVLVNGVDPDTRSGAGLSYSWTSSNSNISVTNSTTKTATISSNGTYETNNTAVLTCTVTQASTNLNSSGTKNITHYYLTSPMSVQIYVVGDIKYTGCLYNTGESSCATSNTYSVLVSGGNLSAKSYKWKIEPRYCDTSKITYTDDTSSTITVTSTGTNNGNVYNSNLYGYLISVDVTQSNKLVTSAIDSTNSYHYKLSISSTGSPTTRNCQYAISSNSCTTSETYTVSVSPSVDLSYSWSNGNNSNFTFTNSNSSSMAFTCDKSYGTYSMTATCAVTLATAALSKNISLASENHYHYRDIEIIGITVNTVGAPSCSLNTRVTNDTCITYGEYTVQLAGGRNANAISFTWDANAIVSKDTWTTGTNGNDLNASVSLNAGYGTNNGIWSSDVTCVASQDRITTGTATHSYTKAGALYHTRTWSPFSFIELSNSTTGFNYCDYTNSGGTCSTDTVIMAYITGGDPGLLDFTWTISEGNVFTFSNGTKSITTSTSTNNTGVTISATSGSNQSCRVTCSVVYDGVTHTKTLDVTHYHFRKYVAPTAVSLYSDLDTCFYDGDTESGCSTSQVFNTNVGAYGSSLSSTSYEWSTRSESNLVIDGPSTNSLCKISSSGSNQNSTKTYTLLLKCKVTHSDPVTGGTSNSIATTSELAITHYHYITLEPYLSITSNTSSCEITNASNCITSTSVSASVASVNDDGGVKTYAWRLIEPTNSQVVSVGSTSIDGFYYFSGATTKDVVIKNNRGYSSTPYTINLQCIITQHGKLYYTETITLTHTHSWQTLAFNIVGDSSGKTCSYPSNTNTCTTSGETYSLTVVPGTSSGFGIANAAYAWSTTGSGVSISGATNTATCKVITAGAKGTYSGTVSCNLSWTNGPSLSKSISINDQTHYKDIVASGITTKTGTTPNNVVYVTTVGGTSSTSSQLQVTISEGNGSTPTYEWTCDNTNYYITNSNTENPTIGLKANTAIGNYQTTVTCKVTQNGVTSETTGIIYDKIRQKLIVTGTSSTGGTTTCSIDGYSGATGCNTNKQFSVTYVTTSTNAKVYEWTLVEATNGLTLENANTETVTVKATNKAPGTYVGELKCKITQNNEDGVSISSEYTTSTNVINFTHAWAPLYAEIELLSGGSNSCEIQGHQTSGIQKSCSSVETFKLKNISGGNGTAVTYAWYMESTSFPANNILNKPTGVTNSLTCTGSTSKDLETVTSTGVQGSYTGTLKCNLTQSGAVKYTPSKSINHTKSVKPLTVSVTQSARPGIDVGTVTLLVNDLDTLDTLEANRTTNLAFIATATGGNGNDISYVWTKSPTNSPITVSSDGVTSVVFTVTNAGSHSINLTSTISQATVGSTTNTTATNTFNNIVHSSVWAPLEIVSIDTPSFAENKDWCDYTTSEGSCTTVQDISVVTKGGNRTTKTYVWSEDDTLGGYVLTNNTLKTCTLTLPNKASYYGSVTLSVQVSQSGVNSSANKVITREHVRELVPGSIVNSLLPASSPKCHVDPDTDVGLCLAKSYYEINVTGGSRLTALPITYEWSVTGGLTSSSTTIVTNSTNSSTTISSNKTPGSYSGTLTCKVYQNGKYHGQSTLDIVHTHYRYLYGVNTTSTGTTSVPYIISNGYTVSSATSTETITANYLGGDSSDISYRWVKTSFGNPSLFTLTPSNNTASLVCTTTDASVSAPVCRIDCYASQTGTPGEIKLQHDSTHNRYFSDLVLASEIKQEAGGNNTCSISYGDPSGGCDCVQYFSIDSTGGNTTWITWNWSIDGNPSGWTVTKGAYNGGIDANAYGNFASVTSNLSSSGASQVTLRVTATQGGVTTTARTLTVTHSRNATNLMLPVPKLSDHTFYMYATSQGISTYSIAIRFEPYGIVWVYKQYTEPLETNITTVGRAVDAAKAVGWWYETYSSFTSPTVFSIAHASYSPNPPALWWDTSTNIYGDGGSNPGLPYKNVGENYYIKFTSNVSGDSKITETTGWLRLDQRREIKVAVTGVVRGVVIKQATFSGQISANADGSNPRTLFTNLTLYNESDNT